MTIDAAAVRDVASVLTRLAELGPPSELRKHGPAVAASALDLDRVLLTSISAAALVAEALHPGGRGGDQLLSALRLQPVPLAYPLIEGEIMRRRRAQVVRLDGDASPARHAFAAALEWSDYVAAPIVLDGSVIGFFQADRQLSDRSVDEDDADALAAFATCFGLVFERAVLRQRLRVQRQEMRQVASWADSRTGELEDRSISVAADVGVEAEAANVQPSGGSGEDALRDLLTRRELDVLRLMVHGVTNAAIAKELVVSEGTVKFHVKNILRKMHASNRAEATSRYLRLTLNRGG